MPEMARYEHGVPSWVDMGSHDLAASVAFYSALFGWTGLDTGAEMGHYTIMSKDGKQVAAIAPAQDPGPPRWTTYVNVDDVAAVAKAAEAAGGEVVLPPMEVPSAGRMAVFKDSTGAFIAGWQAGDHLGAQLVNEAGAFTWSELSTADLAKSKTFYSDVFGWGWGGADEYAEGQVSGRSICGAMPRRPEIPAEVPDYWLVYFGASDLEAGTAKATELGASVVLPPTAVPGTGSFSVLVDPQGATFALFKS